MVETWASLSMYDVESIATRDHCIVLDNGSSERLLASYF